MEGNSSPHHSYPASQHSRGKEAEVMEGKNTTNRTIKNKKNAGHTLHVTEYNNDIRTE
jgi:hypothetical protein